MAIEFLPPPVSQPPEAGLQFRELTPTEIASTEHIFRATGNPLPDPAISTFIGAVEGGKVLAFLVLQIKLHAQPMWIEDGHSELFSRLVKTAEQTILRKCGATWVYLFVAPDTVLEDLAEVSGMAKEPWAVMSKLVAPGREGAGLMMVPPLLPKVTVEEMDRAYNEVMAGTISPTTVFHVVSEQYPITAEELDQYPGDEAIQ